MKFWIARDKNGELSLVNEKPVLSVSKKCWLTSSYADCIFLDGKMFPEVTFENSPIEVELSLFHPVQLTRDYFAKHNWEIVTHKPDENGFILWEAKWKRSMEEESPYYSDLTVTNMMHEDRFCVSGKTGEGNVEYLMAYTEEDLENILKALAIYDYYKKES